MNITMNASVRKIISYLIHNNDDYIASLFISNLIGVSRKTVTRYINEANDILLVNGAYIESKSGYGCKLIIADSKKFHAFFINEVGCNLALVDEPLQHTHFIIRTFLSNEFVKSEAFEETLFLSKTIIMKYYKELPTILGLFNLKTKSLARKGNTIVGTEHDKRCCINYELYFLKNKTANMTELFETLYYNANTIAAIKDKIIAMIKLYKVSYLDSDSISQLASLLYIAHARNNQNFPLTYDEDIIDRFVKRNSYYLSNAIVHELKNTLHLNLNDNDTLFVTIFLVGNRCFLTKNDFPISEDYFTCQKLSIELASYLNNENNFIHVWQDEKLINDFSLNLTQLVTQTEFHLYWKRNISYKKVSLEADLLATQSANFLKKKFGFQLTKEQIYYLSMIIYPLFGRYHFEYNVGKALIISNVNKSVASGLKERLIRNFKNQILSADIFDLYELAEIDLAKYSFVFSSYALSELPTLPKTVLYINLDIFFLENQKISIRNQLIKNNLSSSLQSFEIFENILITKLSKVKNKKDAFKQITQTMGVNDQLKTQIYQSIVEYDRLSNFAIVNNVVFVTPLKSFAPIPTIQMFDLGKNIKWDNTNIQIIVYWERSIKKGYSDLFENESVPHLLFKLFSRNEVAYSIRNKGSREDMMKMLMAENENVMENGSSFR